MTVLQTMWGKAVVVRIRARRVFVLVTALASLLLVALPRAHALDPDRRISQYAHTAWRVRDGAFAEHLLQSPKQPTDTCGLGQKAVWCASMEFDLFPGHHQPASNYCPPIFLLFSVHGTGAFGSAQTPVYPAGKTET